MSSKEEQRLKVVLLEQGLACCTAGCQWMEMQKRLECGEGEVCCSSLSLLAALLFGGGGLSVEAAEQLCVSSRGELVLTC